MNDQEGEIMNTSLEKRSIQRIAIRIFLIALLVGQLLYLVFGALEFYFKVPNFVQDIFAKQCEQAGLTYSAQKQEMSLTGNFKFQHLEFHQSLTQELIASAQNLDLKIGFWRFLTNYISIKEIHAEKVNIYFPLIYAGDNKNLDCIQNLNIQVNFRRNEFHVHRLTADVLGLKCLVEGYASYQNFKKSENYFLSNSIKDKEVVGQTESSISGVLKKIYQFLSCLRSYSEDVQDGILKLKFSGIEKTGVTVRLQSFGSALKYENSFKLKKWIGSATLLIDEDITFLTPIQLEASNMHIPSEEIEIQHASLAFNLQESIQKKLEQKKFLELVTDLEISGTDITWRTCNYDYVNFKKKGPLLEKSLAKLIAYQGSNWFDCEFIGDFLKRKGLVELEVFWNPDQVCLMPMIDEYIQPFKSSFKFQKTPHWRAYLDVSEGFKFDNLIVKFSVRDFEIEGITLDTVEVVANVDKKELFIEKAYVGYHGALVELSLRNNFKTQQFRLLTKGYIYPLELGAWLPTWWTDFFKDFKLGSNSLSEDIEICGNWKDVNELFIYGYAKGHEFEYMDLPVEYVRAQFWGANLYINLWDLYVVAPQGHKGSFDMQWVYRNESKGPFYRAFKGHSTLPLEYSRIVKETEEIRNLFKFDQAPIVNIEGYLYNLSSEESSQNTIVVKAKTSSPFSFYEYPMDYLDIVAVYTPTYIDINPLNFGFAGGVGQGSVRINQFNKGQSSGLDTVSLNVQTHGIHRYKLQTVAPYFQNLQTFIREKPNRNAEKAWNPISEHGGLIDLNLNVTGLRNDLLSYTGYADMHMYDYQIGKIPLFGALSIILNPLLFNLGSLVLNDARAQITVDKNILHFNDAIVQGSSARILMTGDLNIATDELNFSVNVEPFGNVRTPLISQILLVTRPFSKALKLNLRGTLEKPVWQYGNSPMPSF